MNKLNYASREAATRLAKAKIVLDTEMRWIFAGERWQLIRVQGEEAYAEDNNVPAPSMAEVWWELPETIQTGPATWKHLTTEKMGPRMEAYYRPCDSKEVISSENPTDALIDLLIWVKKEKT